MIWNEILHIIFLLIWDSKQFKGNKKLNILTLFSFQRALWNHVSKNVLNLVVTIEDTGDRKMIYVCLRHWCRRNILSMPLGQSSYQCEANIFSLSFGTAKGFFIYDDVSCHRYGIVSLMPSLIPSLFPSLFSLKHITYFLLCIAYLTVYISYRQNNFKLWISRWGEIRILHI